MWAPLSTEKCQVKNYFISSVGLLLTIQRNTLLWVVRRKTNRQGMISDKRGPVEQPKQGRWVRFFYFFFNPLLLLVKGYENKYRKNQNKHLEAFQRRQKKSFGLLFLEVYRDHVAECLEHQFSEHEFECHWDLFM